MRNALRFVEFQTGLLCLAFLFCATQSAECGVIYVDNRAGNNALNGIAPKIVSGKNGPVKTIKRALEYARPGDKIILINNDIPYQESFTLSGKRFSGIGQEMFTILGNGATISGATPVPQGGWKPLQDGLWKVNPFRKGYFNLYLDGKTLPEYRPETDDEIKLTDIPAGHWAAFQGAIYYRELKNQLPPMEAFSLAGMSVGLSLVDVEGVQISDVTFKNFRIDGINVHDRCKNIILENVTCTGNGRSGLAVNGTSQVEVIDSVLTENRINDLLITEQGVANLKQTRLGKPATLAP
ncbi:right-handed parallel beta-helix repeat-containing protein [Gimesia sp.]|uniref:right-handed parallel beta-helix repeat-containing protein n=1 Tax=Gimesia sp. TaxID=2024833 RepID=UPI003A94EE7D